MGNFEGTRRQRLQWIQARLARWSANAAAIGLTSTQVSQATAKVAGAAETSNEAEAARAAAKSATKIYYAADDEMSATVRSLITTIKAYAETSGNVNVYALADLDPPAPRTPAEPPTVPSDVTGFVSPTGDVTLTWKATLSGASTGVFFMIERKQPTEAGFSPIGASALKEFTDATPNLTGGVVQYRVKAVRGTLSSVWSVPVAFDVDNGVGLGGRLDSVRGTASARPDVAGTVGTTTAESKGKPKGKGKAAA